MTRTIVLFAAAASLMMNSPCRAQSDADLAEENAQLRRRVERLERQMDQLKATVGSRQAEGETGEPSPASKAAPQTAAAKPGEDKKPLWSSLDVQFYGYIKADAAWDSSRVTTGNYILFADPDGEDDDEFNLTARQTRLGLRIKGPDVGSIETSGLVEGDFYGTGGAENKPNFRMRHAYLRLNWPEANFSILAGQAWDVIAPLWPDTLNFTILWDAGNIGYRHPQIRVTKAIALSENVDLELAGAVSRTVSDVEEAAGADRPGEDAGLPTLQGRAGLSFPWFGDKPTAIGVSGHWGEEEYPGDNDVESWSVNLDVRQPVNERLSLKGEAFVGANLDDYLGGISQGVRNPTTTADRAIGSKGGWMQASFKPVKDWRFNVGFGIDDVDNSDLGGDQNRARNQSVFGNALYAINEHTDVGLELSHWQTDYQNADDVDDVRIQGSFIYKF